MMPLTFDSPHDGSIAHLQLSIAPRNLHDHKIDFADVKGIFDGPFFIRRSDRHDEIRYQVFGIVEGREIAVACAFRGEVCWIISARRARKDERRKYYDHRERRPPAGED
jgi:uncharacterized DUF497 family protein